ncbi:viral A-type inclusion protein [Reticulomyxa filosa]|uniref:Viral A-type inclusion protein n=1 Tax=Reticulomyxa filosa TaxID=46433 RepID=X6P7U8_RETFI|nr:viral A-type inclusion protein [Reticulomyxa filosa]|eukprot:ETO34600.1 viral A-type inclusion protein [Reticulomyxa filosa]
MAQKPRWYELQCRKQIIQRNKRNKETKEQRKNNKGPKKIHKRKSQKDGTTRQIEENGGKVSTMQARCHNLESQLSSLSPKKQMSNPNFGKIDQHQSEVVLLNERMKYLEDKNDLLNQVFLFTKNALSQDLSEWQEKVEALRMELKGKEERIGSMGEQISEYKKKDERMSELERLNARLSEENNNWKEQYAVMKITTQTQGQQLNALSVRTRELEIQDLALKDDNDKLTSANQQYRVQIQEMLKVLEEQKNESEMTLQMATKKHMTMIKELENQLKVEANQNVQLRSEMCQMKDDLDEMKWREKTKREAEMKANANANATQINGNGSVPSTTSQNEHELVIISLSERFAAVKEDNMTLKNRLNNKSHVIEQLQQELKKKQEWIADLIEKLNEKPASPPNAVHSQLQDHGSHTQDISSSLPSKSEAVPLPSTTPSQANQSRNGDNNSSSSPHDAQAKPETKKK